MTHRTIRDPSGEAWDVWQVEPLMWDVTLGSESDGARADAPDIAAPSFLDPALANGWLCFESRIERRRLAPIPRGWERMTDAELHALCAWATVVHRSYGGALRPDRANMPLRNDMLPPADATDGASDPEDLPSNSA